ncbi:hypothetical protein CEXT_102861 [Caerostris extrusa]|uniref:Uncharacterized protein n=1 Tax=Caerostris extrusa TaxID=172846 RepID=A0AAV4QC94_CAEEX|nr:hypothetical protein CEXT_102861 [Caerostris extrusa]
MPTVMGTTSPTGEVAPYFLVLENINKLKKRAKPRSQTYLSRRQATNQVSYASMTAGNARLAQSPPQNQVPVVLGLS